LISLGPGGTARPPDAATLTRRLARSAHGICRIEPAHDAKAGLGE